MCPIITKSSPSNFRLRMLKCFPNKIKINTSSSIMVVTKLIDYIYENLRKISTIELQFMLDERFFRENASFPLYWYIYSSMYKLCYETDYKQDNY